MKIDFIKIFQAIIAFLGFAKASKFKPMLKVLEFFLNGRTIAEIEADASDKLLKAIKVVRAVIADILGYQDYEAMTDKQTKNLIDREIDSYKNQNKGTFIKICDSCMIKYNKDVLDNAIDKHEAQQIGFHHFVDKM